MIEILRPNAPGTYCQFALQIGAACPNHWENVDEAIPDEDGSCNYTAGDGIERDSYHLEPSSIGAGVINKVTVKASIAWYGAASSHGQYGLRSGATENWGSVIDFTGSYTNYSRDYLTDPNTGLAWTWAAIDVLQVLLICDDIADNGMKCTQIYVEVDYTPPAKPPTFRLDPKPRKRMEFHPSLKLG